MIEPHGYMLELEDGQEVLMDVSIESDRKNVNRRGDIVQWKSTPVRDVFDCETEDHLDPLSWAEEDIWIYP